VSLPKPTLSYLVLCLGLVLVGYGFVSRVNPRFLPFTIIPLQIYHPSEIVFESGYVVGGNLESLKAIDGDEYVYACDYVTMGNAAARFKFGLAGYLIGKFTVEGKITFSNALSGTYLWLLVNGVAVAGGEGYASSSPFLSWDVGAPGAYMLVTDLCIRVRADSQPNFFPTFVQIDELSLTYTPSSAATTTEATTTTVTVVSTRILTQLVTTTVGGVVTTTAARTTITQTTVKTVQVGTATVTYVTTTQYGQTVLKTTTATYTVEQPTKAGKVDISWSLIGVGLFFTGVGCVGLRASRRKEV